MPDITLSLRRSPSIQRSPCAWYLPSASSAEWLAAIASQSVDHSGLRLLPVPTSTSDNRVAGAFVLSGSAELRPFVSWLPYARFGRLYLPADAELYPPIRELELDQLLNEDYVHVWHPGIGLIAAEHSSLLRVADLILPLRRSARAWSIAAPGVAINGRLLSIVPDVELRLDELLEQGRDDIGQDSDSLDELPESPRELADGMLHNAARNAAYGSAAALFGLAKLLAGGADRSGMLAKLREYAAGKMKQIDEARQDLRNKEILRLLRMCEQDPDLGLRFAIPMNPGRHRGRGASGNKLVQRDVDFNLRGLGGGGPADPWNIPYKYQQELLSRYRELANREVRLGRHRRAAYIFARLLNDLDGAASALRGGRHFREAAVIFRDKLQRPLEAAKCLEEGGLWAEAIEQYQTLKMHEKVGDIQTTLGNFDLARESYLAAVEGEREKSNFLEAARIWKDKLNDPDECLATLDAGWPQSAQALDCARAAFDLLAERGRHGEAVVRFEQLGNYTPVSRLYVPFAELLCAQAKNYPDAAARAAGHEATLRVVAARLGVAPRGESQQLTSVLSKLVPQDRLLARDCRRFAAELPVALAPKFTSGKTVRLVRQIPVSRRRIWQSAALVGNSIVLAGVSDHRINLARCNFEGDFEVGLSPWPTLAVRTDSQLLLSADATSGNRVSLYHLGEEPLPSKRAFKASDKFSTPLSLGALVGAPRPWGICHGMHGHTFFIENRYGPVVTCVNDRGDVVNTYALPDVDSADLENAVVPIPMCAQGDQVYLGLGHTLVVIRGPSKKSDTITVPGVIRELVASARFTRSRVAIGLDVGAQVLWDMSGNYTCLPLASDMPVPKVGFNRGGYVIAAGNQSIEVYDTKNGKLSYVGSSSEAGTSPIAVIPGPRTDRFAVAIESGIVSVFEI